MLGLIFGFLLLVAIFLTAYILARYRETHNEHKDERDKTATVMSITVLLQCAHFTEELLMGFHLKLAEILGLATISLTYIIIINLILLGIWIISIKGIRSGLKSAFFAAWFLSIAGTLNFVLHPFFTLMQGSYFPGTISSPFLGVSSIYLSFRLIRATDRKKTIP